MLIREPLPKGPLTDPWLEKVERDEEVAVKAMQRTAAEPSVLVRRNSGRSRNASERNASERKPSER